MSEFHQLHSGLQCFRSPKQGEFFRPSFATPTHRTPIVPIETELLCEHWVRYMGLAPVVSLGNGIKLVSNMKCCYANVWLAFWFLLCHKSLNPFISASSTFHPTAADTASTRTGMWRRCRSKRCSRNGAKIGCSEIRPRSHCEYPSSSNHRSALLASIRILLGFQCLERKRAIMPTPFGALPCFRYSTM